MTQTEHYIEQARQLVEEWIQSAVSPVSGIATSEYNALIGRIASFAAEAATQGQVRCKNYKCMETIKDETLWCPTCAAHVEYLRGLNEGRSEAATAALEQAARLVENYHECPSTNDYNIARDIRALKPEAAKERNVSPECWREEHGDCKCSSLICRCGCHRVEIDYFGASTSDAAIGDDKEHQR